MKFKTLWTFLFLTWFSMPGISGSNILEVMTGKTVDEFRKLLTSSGTASHLLQGELTIFAPSDRALNSYVGLKDDNFILNHMVNVAVQIGDRATYSNVTRISSMLPGSPPLWLTRNGEKYYVNGAEIIMRDIEAKSDLLKRKQRLHFLDNVLEPLVPVVDSNSPAFVDLTAGKLLRDSDVYKITGHSIKTFTSQVRDKKKFSLFDKPGTHTFFVPVDAAFHNLDKELVDGNVIAGHVVPDVLLFTRPLSKIEQKTATYTEKPSSIKVTAVIQIQDNTVQVKSNTVQGNRHHSREHVIANIVKANIPVSNGIVHLIDKPLIVVASPLWKYLEDEEQKGGRLSQFARYINQYGGSLKSLIENAADGASIFAPANEAFDPAFKDELEKALKDPTRGPKILGMHFVGQRISAEDVRIYRPQNEFKMFGARVGYPSKSDDHLWFYYKNNNETLTIDGMGVTADVVEPDIGATNGVIHVINRVLGFPAHTIEEKLSMDPMTSSVYGLGKQNHFNLMFTKNNEKYTYLVPSDEAWRSLHNDFATVHKILFMGDFAYQTVNMLERHLRIGEALSDTDLIDKTAMEGGVNMVKGDPPLKFVAVSDPILGNYTEVQWENIRAKIIRPNLECQNGYIHIIDKVIMKRRDVSISKASNVALVNFALPFIAVLILANM